LFVTSPVQATLCRYLNDLRVKRHEASAPAVVMETQQVQPPPVGLFGGGGGSTSSSTSNFGLPFGRHRGAASGGHSGGDSRGSGAKVSSDDTGACVDTGDNQCSGMAPVERNPAGHKRQLQGDAPLQSRKQLSGVRCTFPLRDNTNATR
jgi:hypothetical protein